MAIAPSSRDKKVVPGFELMWLGAVIALSAGTPAMAGHKSKSADECRTGPITKSFGGTPWLVYACSDRRSPVLGSASGSKALPFVFTFRWLAGQYQLAGVGTGSKAASDAAFGDLRGFSGDDILGLLSEVQAAAINR